MDDQGLSALLEEVASRGSGVGLELDGAGVLGLDLVVDVVAERDGDVATVEGLDGVDDLGAEFGLVLVLKEVVVLVGAVDDNVVVGEGTE